MEALEEFLDCGGWCDTDAKYFRFTDINFCASQGKNRLIKNA